MFLKFPRLFPRQENFFKLFEEAANLLVNSAQQFHDMLNNLDHAEVYAKNIAEQEAQGDNIARSTYDLLHKTFITPFDRQDIIQLIRKLDDILDIINRTAKRIAVYKMKKLPDGINEIAKIGVESTNVLRIALQQLSNLRNTPEILKRCRQVNENESHADVIKMSGVEKLFAEEDDFKSLLKTKEIYDYSKLIISECHRLANLIKGVVLEYS